MRREQLSRVFGNLEDRQIAEAFTFDPDRCDHAPERIVPMKKKRIISFALAAALLLALGATAYAIFGFRSVIVELLCFQIIPKLKILLLRS